MCVCVEEQGGVTQGQRMKDITQRRSSVGKRIPDFCLKFQQSYIYIYFLLFFFFSS